jgi:hypothetical protein
MKMITGVTVALATMAVLAGCSSSDSGDGGDSVGSGQDVADMIGCTGWADDSEEMYVTEGGTCDLEGEEVGAYYFADNEARDNYVDVASSFGGLYLVGDAWVIDGPRDVLEGLQADHGGELSDAS